MRFIRVESNDRERERERSLRRGADGRALAVKQIDVERRFTRTMQFPGYVTGRDKSGGERRCPGVCL